MVGCWQVLAGVAGIDPAPLENILKKVIFVFVVVKRQMPFSNSFSCFLQVAFYWVFFFSSSAARSSFCFVVTSSKIHLNHSSLVLLLLFYFFFLFYFWSKIE
jgi:hypothetical protein